MRFAAVIILSGALLIGGAVRAQPSPAQGDAQAAPEETQLPFGNCDWEMSPDEVKAAVPLPVVGEGGDGANSFIAYSDEFCGMQCAIKYLFNPDGLIKVMIEAPEDQDLAQHLERFRTLRAFLGEVVRSQEAIFDRER